MKANPLLPRGPLSAREIPRIWTAAIAAGLGAGAASAAFLKLYEWVRFWPAGSDFARWKLVSIPALGGLLCGLIVERFEPSARGTGTPELLHAVRARGKAIGARYAAWKTLASVFTTCSGGSAGPEAPMVTFGAGLASWTGRRFGLSPRGLRALTAAGAAAGFAAVFDAPAAGAIFAAEVLLREASAQALSIVALGALAGTAAARALLGRPEFLREAVAGAVLRSPGELVLFAALAAGAAMFAKLFIEVAIHVEKGFDKIFRRPMLRAAAGGLLLGLLALIVPQALGNSHPDVPRLFASESAAPLAGAALLLLLFGKVLACPLTVGSGGSGGIFIPYLMMGATLGAGVGHAAHAAFPWTGPASAYMLVGMGAVFASITLAPLTAIALVLELTRCWGMALPLAFTVGAAVLIARAIEPESLDTRKLLKKGISLRELADEWAIDTPVGLEPSGD